MSEPTFCEKCGERISSDVPGGQQKWPFCPHPKFTGVMIERDEIPGGVTVENYGPNPMTFYTHSERRAYMKKHGLVEMEKFCPLPGTDRDPQGIPNPKGYMDPQTLENARILLSRGAKPKEPEFDGVRDGVLTDFHAVTITPEMLRGEE